MKKTAKAIYKKGKVHPIKPISDIKENTEVEILYESKYKEELEELKSKQISWEELEKILAPAWELTKRLPKLNLCETIEEDRDRF